MTNENPARWAPDPMGRHEYRYWDGSQWTDTVADNGVTGLDAPLPTPDVVAVDRVAPATAAWASYRRLPTWAQVVIPTVAVVLGLGAIGSLTSSDSGSPQVADAPSATLHRVTTPSTTTSSTTTSTTTTTTTTTVPPTTVPPTTAPPPPTEAPTVPPPPPTQAFVAPAPAGGGCDPNYSGCVPIASDVDCAGGSGNGPAYVAGPVQVIGVDIYELDYDHDGIGCE